MTWFWATRGSNPLELPTNQISVPPLSLPMTELIKLLTSLKAKKAGGHDDLSPSVLIADPQGLVRFIGPLFRRIWEECVFPEGWGLSDVSLIGQG